MIASSLPDLEQLDLEAAKALLIAQHETYAAALSSRTGEIERLKLLPVRVVEEPVPVKEAATGIPPVQPGTIHIELPGRALISLEGSVAPAMIRAVLRSLGA